MQKQNKITVRECRLRAGITQRELGRALGVAYNTVSRWELGTVKISDINRYKVAQFFGVEPDQIM